MAPGRLYRNYTLDDGLYDVPSQRTSLPRAVLDSSETIGSQRTLGSGRGHGRFSAEKVPPHEDDFAASEIQASRVVVHSVDSATVESPSLADPKHGRGPLESGDNQTQDRVQPPAGYATSSPPLMAAGRLLHRTDPKSESGRQSSPVSKDGANDDHAAATNMPDFFSPSVFQVVLGNPTIAHQLLKFSETRFCGEHMEFLARVKKYHVMLHEVSMAISRIYEDFFADEAPKYVNVPQAANERAKKDSKLSISTTLPSLESVFAGAQKDVERMIYGDIYPQFVRHQMSVSAAKALGGDRSKYAGLGDCFVLTDPTKADNPIVFASEGFVKVTGHPRRDIIPRNCRFLQSQQTDRAAALRIKDAIDKREESVELLLNQKKNGEPFWNLLYITPLFGQDGNLVFFLGGQINCSTTIHSTSDVLRILALSREVEEDSRTNSTSSKPSPGPSRSIRHPFGSNRRSSIQQRVPGMETGLVDRIGSLPLTSQFREFYTAYSNFIVINYSTYLIAFVSGGIIDLLFPIKANPAYHDLAVGTDIFRFLANHGSGSGVSWEFKSSVKNALKMGQPISLDLKLCAKPSMGFEKFVLHWTPLKDEAGTVKWIVLTLGNEHRA